MRTARNLFLLGLSCALAATSVGCANNTKSDYEEYAECYTQRTKAKLPTSGCPHPGTVAKSDYEKYAECYTQRTKAKLSTSGCTQSGAEANTQSTPAPAAAPSLQSDAATREQKDRAGVQQIQSILGDSLERSCVNRGGNPIRQSNGEVICQQPQPQTSDCYSTGMGRHTCTTQ